MSDLGQLAKSRLEELVAFAGVNVEADIEETEDGIRLNVVSGPSTARLIGHHGETLRSFEYLVAQMVRRVDSDAPRVSVDIAGYREARCEQLAEKAREIVQRVKESGREYEMRPMNPADRRIVHMTVKAVDGVTSESRGEGRARRIVVLPE